MNLGALIGLIMGLGILGAAAAIGAGDAGVGWGSLVDVISFLIVVGGARTQYVPVFFGVPCLHKG